MTESRYCERCRKPVVHESGECVLCRRRRKRGGESDLAALWQSPEIRIGLLMPPRFRTLAEPILREELKKQGGAA